MSQEQEDALCQMRKDYPFLTYLEYCDVSVIGIVQNVTTQFIMIFNYEEIKGEEQKKKFLELGENWWYESNTKVPIDVFLGDKFEEFRRVLRGYSRREVKQVVGPMINLSEMYNRRIKKRRVEFMRP